MGVEQPSGQGVAGQVEHFEVLGGGVHDGEAIAREHLGQRLERHGQRIDECDAALPGNLYEGHLRVVGALAMELGIDGVARLVEEFGDQIVECRGGGDDAVLGHCVPAQPASVPETNGKPAASQALVPPAMFTASTPLLRRNVDAVRLRPPAAQIT
ncbi:unannotated protein [freshwater metagenome]|uniref:Unannotated protein n=1 Tax=freshwater metagenome TaxID=449393 RepID=A0A6J7R897_9ZZZZ